MADREKLVALIGMDKSESSAKAFEWYASHLHKPGNYVILLYVSEVHFPYGAEMAAAEVMQDHIEKAKEDMKEFEQKLVALMQNHGVGGKVKVVLGGRAGEVIVEMAKTERANYIVMGTRGMGTIRRTILGSVSDYVLHHVHCPVFIYRQ